MEDITLKDIIAWMLQNSESKEALEKINKASYLLLKHDNLISDKKRETLEDKEEVLF